MPSRQFACVRTVELPATPEQVYAAVATPAGNASWLFPNEINTQDPNTVADPPHRFAMRQEQGEWFNALDFVIDKAAGDDSVLQYSHTGVFFDDNPSQDTAIQQHTDFYLHTLAEYLRYFSPRTATYVGDVPGGIQGPPESSARDAFDRVKSALGVAGNSAQGDRVRISVPGIGPIKGVLDYVHPNFIGIRTSDGLYRFFGRNAFGGPVGMSIHLFSPDVDAERTKSAWQTWLNAIFNSV